MEKYGRGIGVLQGLIFINIGPGRMFTLQNQYNNCFRLSTGMVWNEKVERALKNLGRLASKLR